MTLEDRYHFEPMVGVVESAIGRGESVGSYHHAEVLRLLRAALAAPVAPADAAWEALDNILRRAGNEFDCRAMVTTHRPAIEAAVAAPLLDALADGARVERGLYREMAAIRGEGLDVERLEVAIERACETHNEQCWFRASPDRGAIAIAAEYARLARSSDSEGEGDA